MVVRMIPFLVLGLLGFGQAAQAYVDPGSGTMLFQLALAVVAGVFFKITHLGRWLKSWRQPKPKD
jgi:hypothetical protein